MSVPDFRALTIALAIATALRPLPAQQRPDVGPLDRTAITRAHFGNDAAWYAANIPLLDIDDPEIEQTYYYRWQVYRSHLRELGASGGDVTEFLPSVPWARHPFEDLNDSSSFHIAEGRWLRDPLYVQQLIDHLYSDGGNDRHFSEWIAAATLGWVQVTGDPAPALRHLDAMQYVYNAWDDHFDATRNLYWIEPLLDATEYTISSIDASGAGFTNVSGGNGTGFTGGEAFRPSINSYQYGNALAIAALARQAGNPALAQEYQHRADLLRAATLKEQWNPSLGHFTDIYQRSTKFVNAGDFIRGRELVGFVPWQFELPPKQPLTATPDYDSAWSHAVSPTEFSGPHGLRTAEPTYPRYMVQYRYDNATVQPECQWNGPSWPFQTSQTLTGLANLLNDYPSSVVSKSDYVHLLRQYTAQHRLADGTFDVQEDYNPDTGHVIVGLPRSHHYLHSTYNDLVLSGLVGIRPRGDNVLEINPLLPQPGSPERPIRFFAVQGLRYHGYDLTILYDVDGSRYHQGDGLTVLAQGHRLAHAAVGQPLRVHLESLPPTPSSAPKPDLAVNVWAREPSPHEVDLPIASASSTAPETNVYEPLDGRLWYFPEVPHGWSPLIRPAAKATGEWFAVDLRRNRPLGSVELAFFQDKSHYAAPATLRIQSKDSLGHWADIPNSSLAVPVANGPTLLRFAPVQTQELRVRFERPLSGLPPELISFRVFSP